MVELSSSTGGTYYVSSAEDAKVGCPVSKAITGVDITLDAVLEG